MIPSKRINSVPAAAASGKRAPCSAENAAAASTKIENKFIRTKKNPLPTWVEDLFLSHGDHFLGAGGVDGHGGVEVGFGGAHF